MTVPLPDPKDKNFLKKFISLAPCDANPNFRTCFFGLHREVAHSRLKPVSTVVIRTSVVVLFSMVSTSYLCLWST
jgi:hypothetical protein